ncbi:MAG: hypothetical protein ACYCQK_02700 [Acidiferrobacteraceae bacterium]
MNDENEEHKTTLDHVLDSLPPDRAAAAAKLMVRYGIAEHDPAIVLIAAVLDADAARTASAAAAQAAGEAAIAVKEHASKIPDAIYAGTVRAGADLTSLLGKEVRDRGIELGQGITAAIQSAADTGAAALKQAAADLPGVAAAKQDAIVQDMRIAVAAAARDEARGALAARMARSWGMVVLSLALAAGIGAGGMWAAARLSGHLTPWADPLQFTSAGVPNCGALRGTDGREYRVCLTR